MSKLVPKLRFKEFSGEWKKKIFSDFIHSYKGGAPLKQSDFVLTSNYEVIPKKAIQGGGKLMLDKDNPTYCSEKFFNSNQNNVVDNSYLITTLRDLVPTGPNIGYIVKNNNENRFMLAQGVYGFIINSKLNSDFIIQLSNSIEYRRLMQKIMVGSTQVHIRNQVFFSINLIFPKLPEQQKIANCLSYLDTLIEAQNKKVEALKKHKKGLMQGLFPAEGEREPKLRFEGFSGEWEETILGNVAEFIDSLHETPKHYEEEGYPMIRVTDIKANGLDLNTCLKVTEKIYTHFTKRYKPAMGDIIFSRVGSCGESVLINFKESICLGQNTVLLKPKANSLYLFFYLKSDLTKEQVNKKVVGSSHKTLSIKDTKNFDIKLPCEKEQQKIANCLSSLANLIESQNNKVEALKKHKKGLMQQLFVNEDTHE